MSEQVSKLHCIRYSVNLIDSEGKVHDHKNGLLLSEYEKLPTPEGMKWTTVGWSNPLAPNDWKDG